MGTENFPVRKTSDIIAILWNKILRLTKQHEIREKLILR